MLVGTNPSSRNARGARHHGNGLSHPRRQQSPVLDHFTQPGVSYLSYASRRFYAITARGGRIPREFPLI